MFGLFRKAVNNDPESSEFDNEQAVILRSVFESGDEFGTDEERNALHALEDSLDNALSKAGFEHDGHEIGDGEFLIYCYGSNADEMISIIKACIKKYPFIWYDVILRYGAVNDKSARETHLRLNAKAI